MSVLLALMLPACSEYDLKREEDVPPTEEETTPTEPPEEDPLYPDILVEPAALDYDYVLLNCEFFQTVTVSNVGEATLNVSGMSVAEGEQSAWAVMADETEFALEPGESREFEIRFKPGAEEGYEARIDVSSDDPDEPEAGVDTEGVGATAGRMEEIFFQEPSGATDILWVVDNSESMASTLTYVADNFEKFIDPFLELEGLDWQIAVVTTDMENPAQQGRFQGPVITPDSADPRGDFLRAVDQGAAGSANEKPFDAIQAALTDPLLSGPNAGFLREDARLSTIVVTDEDDVSGVSYATFTTWYLGLKDDLDDLSFSAFAGDPGGGLFGCSEWLGWADGLISATSADKLYEVIQATDGVFYSICSTDFTEGLALMSLDAAGMTDTFYLQAVPASIADMEVQVNNEDARFDNVDGWQFDWDRNAVIFYGEAIPPADSVVEINYDADGVCDG